MSRTVFAHTQTGSYPDYINITEDQGGVHRVTMRHNGVQAVIDLTRDVAENMARSILQGGDVVNAVAKHLDEHNRLTAAAIIEQLWPIDELDVKITE